MELEEIKGYISRPPFLTFTNLGDPVYLNFSVFDHIGNSVLVCNEEGQQTLIYYVI